MPFYDYRCESCNHVFEGISTISGRNEPQECPECGSPSPRDIESELGNMGNFNATCQEKERWSWSMGVNPQDIPAAMKQYPGSEYRPDTGQLRVKSRSHKLQELRKRNMEEYC